MVLLLLIDGTCKLHQLIRVLCWSKRLSWLSGPARLSKSGPIMQWHQATISTIAPIFVRLFGIASLTGYPCNHGDVLYLPPEEAWSAFPELWILNSLYGLVVVSGVSAFPVYFTWTESPWLFSYSSWLTCCILLVPSAQSPIENRIRKYGLRPRQSVMRWVILFPHVFSPFSFSLPVNIRRVNYSIWATCLSFCPYNVVKYRETLYDWYNVHVLYTEVYFYLSVCEGRSCLTCHSFTLMNAMDSL